MTAAARVHGVRSYDLGVTGEPDAHEEILAGGNMTAVVRVGDTVRRAAGPWTPTVHAFMRHLRASGFKSAPAPLGIEERGRETSRCCLGRPRPTRCPSSRGRTRR